VGGGRKGTWGEKIKIIGGIYIFFFPSVCSNNSHLFPRNKTLPPFTKKRCGPFNFSSGNWLYWMSFWGMFTRGEISGREKFFNSGLPHQKEAFKTGRF